MTVETMGDRCKAFEQAEAGRRLMPGIPVLARLDGRAFHTFTRGLPRPFDPRLTRCMVETTRFLVDELQPRVGYTQSDEISLVWHEPRGSERSLPFGGRIQKLVSLLSGAASARFGRLVRENIPERAEETPIFDCRVWQVPTLEDTLEVFAWREADAVRNSLSMAAGAFYSDAELHGRSAAEKHELLHAKGLNWNDYPAAFKRGTYVQRRPVDEPLDEARRLAIPEAHRPAPGESVKRSRVVELDLPPLRRLSNAAAVLFDAAPPTFLDP